MSNQEGHGTTECQESNAPNRNLLEIVVEYLNAIVNIMRQADEREYGSADTNNSTTKEDKEDTIERPKAPTPDHPRNRLRT